MSRDREGSSGSVRAKLSSPDNIKFYGLIEATKVFGQLKPVPFSLSDVILVLLYAQSDKPIHGRTLMMKEVFLTINEILSPKRVEDPKFVPHRYGMYSFLVANRLKNLQYNGLIKVEGKKHASSERFQLSNIGIEKASAIFGKLSYHLQNDLREKRKGWDQLGIRGILRLVYGKYPKFTARSKLRDRYKPITWGKE